MSNILLVDDEKSIRDMIRDMLPEDHTLLLCDGSNKPCRFSDKTAEIDLIIADIRLPCCVRACLSTTSTPLIVVSGDHEKLREYEGRGCTTLRKPFCLDELLDLVKKALEKAVKECS